MSKYTVAKPVKRSAAYAIDAAILLVPLSLSVAWNLSHNFSPTPLYGWISLAGNLLVVILVSIIYALQNSSSGQTLGKRLVGLRVLRAESLQQADFIDSYARGFSYLLGLLGLGIAPLYMVSKNRKQAEWESWPHKAGNTRVIDIRCGSDPFDKQPPFYPLYPEEWTNNSPAQLLETYPPLAREMDKKEPSLAQIMTAVPRITPDISQQQKRREKTRHRLTSLGLSFTSLTGITLLLLAFSYAGYALQPAPATPADPKEVLASSLTSPLPVNGYSGSGFPGYATSPSWSQKISAKAQVLANSNTIYTLENRTLASYSVQTGQKIQEFTVSDKVDIVAATQYKNEKPGIYWSIGNKAYGWAPELGLAEPVSAEIPAGAKPYAAGAQLLFVADADKEGNYRAWQFTVNGFKELKVPEGYVPGTIAGANLISSNAGGDIRITSADGQEISSYPLSPPKEGQSLAAISAIGYNRIVALWSPYPESTAANNPMIISSYQASDGQLLSYLASTRERILENQEVVWGSDGQRASFASYTFDVASGRAVQDLKANGVKPSRVLAQAVLGESDRGRVYVTDQAINSISGITPLAVTDSYAIIKTSDQTIEKYSK